MICPQCGYDIGNKNKCVRCGFEVKTIAVVDNPKSEKAGNDNTVETKVIDPCNVFLTHPYGYDDDFGTGFGPFGDPFASLFDDIFGDPISDLLGGLFGINIGGTVRRTVVHEPEPPKKKKKQGPVIEVRDVEIIENDAKHSAGGNNAGAQAGTAHAGQDRSQQNAARKDIRSRFKRKRRK